MRTRSEKALFDGKIASVLDSLDAAHSAFLEEDFGGPSLHFHIESLKAAENRDFERFAEQIYALLPAWGMHRMGPGGSKVLNFQPFKDSLQRVRPIAEQLMDKRLETLESNSWRDLENVFRGITCMRSETSLVGNSKVMAHWLPHLVPPVDRNTPSSCSMVTATSRMGWTMNGRCLRACCEGFSTPYCKPLPLGRRRPSGWHTRQNILLGTALL